MASMKWPFQVVEITYPDRWKRHAIEIKDREISEELQSDEQGADRRFLFTTAIYNYLHYSSTKQLDQFQH